MEHRPKRRRPPLMLPNASELHPQRSSLPENNLARRHRVVAVAEAADDVAVQAAAEPEAPQPASSLRGKP